MDDFVKTRAYKNVAQLHRKLAARKRNSCIEDRAGRGVPQNRQKKTVIVPRLLAADGKFVTDATEKKKIVTTFFASLWGDQEKLHGGIPDWVYARWNTEVLDLFPLYWMAL